MRCPLDDLWRDLEFELANGDFQNDAGDDVGVLINWLDQGGKDILLTGDDLAAPDRRGKASLPGLVHAALVAYPTYADPASGRLITPEEAIDLVAPPPPIADPSPRPCLRPPA